MIKNQICEPNSRQDQRAIQDAEIKDRLSHIKNKILVMSGKGGVGKSSIAAYLAVCLANKGYKVGLMDIDLHGPSIPRLLGLNGTVEPAFHAGKIMPVSFMPKLDVISIEVLMGEDKDAATIWRGPLKIGVIRQFISDIEWPDLDYLIIDSPPGTGDEPLTVAQTIKDARALIVTTPQEISLADVRKSINFCRQVNMEILGLIENMSGLTCPNCGKMIELFKTRGGMVTATKQNLRLLASLPIEPELVQDGDMGSMSVLKNDQLAYTRAFNKMTDEVIKRSKKDIPKKLANKALLKKKKDPADNSVIVIPVSEGKLSSHFGHSEQFAFIDTEKGKITGTKIVIPPTHQPGVIPRWAIEQGADVVICRGLGDKAQQLLAQNGIEVITGAPVDSPEALAKQYLSGNLIKGNNVCDH